MLPLSHAFITTTAYAPEFLDEQGDGSRCVKSSSSRPCSALSNIINHSATPCREKLRLYEKYPAYTFDQLSTHFLEHLPAGFNQTFKQRYWVEDKYYKWGGPVFILDGGEATGVERLPYLETGIVKYLAEATGGLGIILEHRYYGRSHVSKVEPRCHLFYFIQQVIGWLTVFRICPQKACSFSQPRKHWLTMPISL